MAINMIKERIFRIGGALRRSALNPQPSTLNSQLGFTIVELLVVIAIIAILAGAITMGVNGMFYKSRYGRAKAMRAMIQAGIETYYARKGEWPRAIRSKVDSAKEDAVELDPNEVDECIREIVKVSVGSSAHPVLDPAGLFVCRNATKNGCKDIHKSWDRAADPNGLHIIKQPGESGYSEWADVKCNGKCPHGRDFTEAVKKKSKYHIPLSAMNFGYPGPNNGCFCRFRMFYYPKSDTIKMYLQRANEYYSERYRNGYIDD